MAGARLGVNPCDEPDVDAAKARAREALRTPVGADLQVGPPLRDLLTTIQPGDYVGILSYLPPSPAVRDRLDALRRTIVEKSGAAVTLGHGPRYLHSTGQMHKGGPNTGVFVLLTTDVTDDLTIPGESFTFGQLFRAQALGDRAALQAAGRQVAHLHLARPVESALEELCGNISAS